MDGDRERQRVNFGKMMETERQRDAQSVQETDTEDRETDDRVARKGRRRQKNLPEDTPSC